MNEMAAKKDAWINIRDFAGVYRMCFNSNDLHWIVVAIKVNSKISSIWKTTAFSVLNWKKKTNNKKPKKQTSRSTTLSTRTTSNISKRISILGQFVWWQYAIGEHRWRQINTPFFLHRFLALFFFHWQLQLGISNIHYIRKMRNFIDFNLHTNLFKKLKRILSAYLVFVFQKKNKMFFSDILVSRTMTTEFALTWWQ